MPSRESLLPVLLEPILVERVWGTHDLGTWHTPPKAEQLIGELWLTAEECPTADDSGTLQERTAREPEAFGTRSGENFPLLLKLLFPREKLSVQVHPGDAEAQASGHARGKTECWYVLSAEENARVAVGLRHPASTGELRRAILDGTVESNLRTVPVKAGDLVLVEAGTIHAVWPGMVLLEIQQYCDVTYRLWDYGRPRELHLDSGLAVVRSETRSGLVDAVPMRGFDRLVATSYFVVDRFRLVPGISAELGESRSMQILIVTGPAAELRSRSSSLTLATGRAAVVPADGSAAWTLAADAPTEVIRVLHPVKSS